MLPIGILLYDLVAGAPLRVPARLAIAARLAANDAKNVQAPYDLAFVEDAMGYSLRLRQRTIAAGLVPEVRLLQEVALYPAGNQVQELVADRDEKLGAVLPGGKHAPEQLHLLGEANGISGEMVSSSLDKLRTHHPMRFRLQAS